MSIGGTKEETIKVIYVHIPMKNEKIYLEENWTEEGLSTELLQEYQNRIFFSFFLSMKLLI
jgi:hypothetical protein